MTTPMLMLGVEAEFENLPLHIGESSLPVNPVGIHPSKQKTTLFVKGEVPLGKIMKALTDDVDYIYLGAGGLSCVGPEYVHSVIRSFPKKLVNLEIPASTLMLYADEVLASLNIPIITFVGFGKPYNILWDQPIRNLVKNNTRALGKVCTGGVVITFPLITATVTAWTAAGYPNDKVIGVNTK